MFRLISQLEDRVKVVSEEIASLEGVDKKADELNDKIMKLNRALAVIKVWHQDHAETEEKLMVSKNFSNTFPPHHDIDANRCE